MADGWIDPGSLEGDALARWYSRSPVEIEQERQAAAARRYQNFFHGSSGTDPDPAFRVGAPTFDQDVDPDFSASLPSTSRDVDPGFTWVPAGPNRWRNVKVANAVQSPGGLAVGHRAAMPPRSPSRTVTATAQPSAPLQPAGRASRLSGTGVAQRQPQSPQGTWYGSLYAPPPDDLGQLRRQQAEFARTTREIDKQNSWLAIPALAPVAAVFGLEGAAAVAGPAIGAESIRGPLHFVEREAWQRAAQKAAQALSDAEKNALRGAARTKFARANGVSASEMQAEVHHSDPLEWAHLKPDADPNRLANLWGLRKEAHAIPTREWGAFTRSLEGRLPSQAELMEAKLRIDRMVAPYIRRAGVPRSNRLPGKGGPL